MTLMISPDVGIPMVPEVPVPLVARVSAGAATAELLMEHGMELEITPQAVDEANQLAQLFAEDPERAEARLPLSKTARMLPASLLMTRQILDEYGQAVLKSALEIRHLVTNKLVNESENPDPRVRIRALELLGKISDVGLFTERSEVTITHQSTDDLRAKLREKLLKVRDGTVPDSLFPRIPQTIDVEVIREGPEKAAKGRKIAEKLQTPPADVEFPSLDGLPA